MVSGPLSVCDIFTLMFIFTCCIVTTQIGRLYCMSSELEPIQVGSSLNGGVLDQSGPNPTFTRLRALLPLISGTIAKILHCLGEQPANESEAIPLKHLSSLQAVPATLKK